tara:strand:+ start:4254 stop:4820 length:567 start_codon:yes stop_codon:yes gene_type:complete
MEEFLLFFLSIFVFFIIMNKLYKKGEVLSIRSSIDNKMYNTRKLPDALDAANKLAIINQEIIKLIEVLDTTKEGVSKLKENYNPETLSETLDGAKYTSYSVNKGEKISLCIRKLDNTFIENNTILFVVIHELAHVMTEEVGHTDLFWSNMKYLLEEAEKIGIYQPINYKERPVQYCGMEINTTPYNFK